MGTRGKLISCGFATFSIVFVVSIIFHNVAAVSPSPTTSTSTSTSRTFEPRFTHNGGLCASECSKKGKSYNWCYINKEVQQDVFGYSGTCTPNPEQMRSLQNEAVNGVISSYGLPCQSECSSEKHSSYFSCDTQNWKPTRLSKTRTWDYCSPALGYDYKMKKCTSDCGYQGKCFKWCYYDDPAGFFGIKTWGYCGNSVA